MIWVVTDHRATREALVPLIDKLGYEISSIECGDEVLKRIRFQSPALVIIDCAFPDAFELIARIRAEHRSKTVPIIMFSSDSQNLKETALHKGADAYVPKGSLDWAELMAEVTRYAGPPTKPQ